MVLGEQGREAAGVAAVVAHSVGRRMWWAVSAATTGLLKDFETLS